MMTLCFNKLSFIDNFIQKRYLKLFKISDNRANT